MRRAISGATAPCGSSRVNSSLGLTPADHRLGAIGLAAGDRAGRPAPFDNDLVDRRVEHDLDALPRAPPCHRLGDRAHAADRMAPGAGDARRLAEHMVEQHIGRARRIGAGIVADHRVEAEQRLDQIVAEIAVRGCRRPTW